MLNIQASTSPSAVTLFTSNSLVLLMGYFVYPIHIRILVEPSIYGIPPFGDSRYFDVLVSCTLTVILTTFFAIGFGFDHHTNDYKIVRIMYFGNFYCHYNEKEPPKAEVYSLSRNSWRRIGTKAGCYAIDKSATAVVHGVVHWFASRTKGASGNFILTFDFGFEEFGEILLPKYDQPGKATPHVSLSALRGSLALILGWYDKFQRFKRWDVWVMSEYGMVESWTKRYSIVPEERCFRCLGIINNNELVLDKSTREELVSCDLERMQFKHLAISKYTKDVVNFSESLVLYNEGLRLSPRKYLVVEGGVCLGKRKRSVFMHLQKKWL